jgi:hypothetical protein
VRASVVACGDTPPVFEFGKHVLDLVALTVERFVIIERLLAVLCRRDTWDGTALNQAIAKPVAVITAVGNQRGGLGQAGQQYLRPFMIAHLTGGEVEQDRSANLVADGVQLGVQAAFCPSQTAGKAPFCARLAAVRWAFKCVASIMTRSGFRPPVANAVKIRSNSLSARPGK